MVGVYQFDPDLVRARRHPGQIDRVDVTRVRPPPRHVVHVDVQMANSRGRIEGSLPEYRDDVHVLRPPLDPDGASIQEIGKRLVYDELGSRLVRDFGYGVAPRTSFALRAALTSVPVDV